MTDVGLWKFASINPLTPEFSGLPVGTEVEFLPLENIWADGKADYAGRKKVGTDSSYTQFRSGDILVPKVTPTVFHGRSMIADIEGEVGLATSEVHVLRAKSNADPRWLTYQMLTARFLDEARGNVLGVAGLKRISTQYLTSYKVEDTPLETQRRIADYLDTEISEMDALIEEFEGLIASLGSRRRVFAANLVQADQYPLVPLSTVVSMNSGDSISSDAIREIDDYPVYGGNGLRGYTNIFNSETECVLIGRQGALCGNVHRVRPRFFATEHALVVKPKQDVNLIWLEHALREMNLGELSTSVAQPGITATKVLFQRIHLPPLREQEEIAQRLQKEISKIDALIEESTQLIESLKARKTALITEVVTGRKEV
ncbi:restriction endonuclease subunit S [Corynebacterium coyleae]|uniref:restriction endonuclease subunit S n=1 Tax=Corynebacterium coyleae TaxID=53374 RepID=UPI00254B4395|nr:restriction endonuclease subunit S [Corynebacterium coyleae]MDK8664890.1 restriction endonuclease subunit S [Corynebacterium coyleae]MDK8708007.1 restriction endonuclease subunit S [Corynebacterium coyleae]MDK8734844.1 restriction endonuclease subunit S [Corynebacterium coyleae]MDK8894051.1 restriction endonuclease subunit S [Corynebacterium coyleae]